MQRARGRRRAGRRLLGREEGPRRAQGHWDESGTEARSPTQIVKPNIVELADTQGAIARNDGDADRRARRRREVIEATYVFPYLAHAPMEPHQLRHPPHRATAASR